MADHPLDSPGARSVVVESVLRGGHLKDAARDAGVTERRLTRYLAKHAEFKLEVDTARERSQLREHHAPRIPAKVTRTALAEVMLEGDPGEHDARDPDAFLALVSAHANDGDSRGCSKALEILDRWHNAGHYLAIQAEAKRRAAQLELDDQVSAKPVIIEVPVLAEVET